MREPWGRRPHRLPAALPVGHRGAWLFLMGWVATRVLVVWLLLGRHAWVTGDLAYYATSLEAVSDVGLRGTLVEYPLPGVVVVAFPWLLAEWSGGAGEYADLVLAVSLVADACFALLLARYGAVRHGGSGDRSGLLVWVLGLPLLGATAYARFDLVPGLFAGVGLLLLARHPRVAAAAAALATGLKLWPVVLLPALAARAAGRRAVVSVAGGLGILIAGASLAAAGAERLLSPLTWQADRGLQVESVAATPAMVGWVLLPQRYQVGYAASNAFEVDGPGVDGLLAVAEVATLLLVPALGWLWVSAWRSGARLTADAVVWMALAAVATLMATSKVLSPQYLLWLLPLAASGVALTGSRALRRWAVVLLAATAATQVVFPERYLDLTTPGDGFPWGVLALALRNTLMVWLAVTAWRAALAAVSAASRSSASRRGPRGTTPAPGGGGPTTPDATPGPRWWQTPRRAPGARRSAPPPPPASRRS